MRYRDKTTNMPMVNSTPSVSGPRQDTLNFLRTFARLYRPQMDAQSISAPAPQAEC